VPRCLQ